LKNSRDSSASGGFPPQQTKARLRRFRTPADQALATEPCSYLDVGQRVRRSIGEMANGRSTAPVFFRKPLQ
jgi:hypothetical protein